MKQSIFSSFSNTEFDPNALSDNILSDKVVDWLTELYDATDWRCVTVDEIIDREYDGIAISSYFKALVLPYLVNIPPSERALARIILARSNLQKLCGFRVGHQIKDDYAIESDTPAFGLRTFWHFRDKYEKIYSELVVKVLISLVLSGKQPNLHLPFVENITENEFSDNGHIIKWSIDAYKPDIFISLPWTEKDLSTKKDREKFDMWEKQWSEKFRLAQTLDEYRNLKIKHDEEYKSFARRIRRGFTEIVTFPIDVWTTLGSGKRVFFRLNPPNWLNKDLSSPQLSFPDRKTISNTLQPVGKYDKACNLLVVREINNKKEILLSRRKVKNGGVEKFAVPGGKQNTGESLEQCAKRELEEETGLILKKSKPVSLFYTWQESMEAKQVMSVGALIQDWDGQVETKEPDKHVKWDWYPLDDLPEPIFEFTSIAIVQYLENKYPNLTWDDVEEKPSTPAAQLSFF